MDAFIATSIVLTVAVLVAMVVDAVRLGRRLGQMPRAQRISCLLFPTSQIACVAGIAFGTMALGSSPVILFTALVLGVACIPLDSLLFTALGRAECADILRSRARLLEAQVAARRAEAKGLVFVVDEARDIRNKIADELVFLDEQLARGEVDASGKSVDDIIVLASRKTLHVCDHAALDALVSLKLREFKAKGVDVACSLKVPVKLAIPDSELCALVSNMLDNALHACEAVDAAERFVSLRAFVQGSYLVLDMRNSEPRSAGALDALAGSHGLFTGDIFDRVGFAEKQTRGGALAEHGWGLSVIDTIVQRHDGAVSLERSEGEFRTSVMLGLAVPAEPYAAANGELHAAASAQPRAASHAVSLVQSYAAAHVEGDAD